MHLHHLRLWAWPISAASPIKCSLKRWRHKWSFRHQIFTVPPEWYQHVGKRHFLVRCNNKHMFKSGDGGGLGKIFSIYLGSLFIGDLEMSLDHFSYVEAILFCFFTEGLRFSSRIWNYLIQSILPTNSEMFLMFTFVHCISSILTSSAQKTFFQIWVV